MPTVVDLKVREVVDDFIILKNLMPTVVDLKAHLENLVAGHDIAV